MASTISLMTCRIRTHGIEFTLFLFLNHIKGTRHNIAYNVVSSRVLTIPLVYNRHLRIAVLSQNMRVIVLLCKQTKKDNL